MINHIDTIHFTEVRHYKTYSYRELRKQVMSLFKIPEKTHVLIKEMMLAQLKPSESVLLYIGQVQDNVTKAF